jgi:hypothetical protein
MSIKTYRYWEPTLDLRVFRGFPEQVIPDLRDRLTSFKLEDTNRGFDTVIIELDNADGALLRLDSLATGVVFKVSFGYPGALSPPRLMQCRAINGALRVGGLGAASGPHTTAGGIITLTLKSQIWNMNYQRALSSVEGDVDRDLLLEGITITDAVRAIARRYGFDGPSLLVEDLPEEPRLESTVIPARWSSAEWIKNEANHRGWVFRIDSDGFHFHSYDFTWPTEGGPEELSWFMGEPDVIEWNIKNDLNVPQNINIREGSVRKETAFGSFGISTEAGQTFRGAGVWRTKPKGRQKELSPNLMLTAPNSEVRNKRMEKNLSKAARRWRLRLLLVGNPNVRFGRKLKLRNFGPLIDGEWRARKTIHTYRPGDVYRTEIAEAVRKSDLKGGSRETYLGSFALQTENAITNRAPGVWRN